MLAYLKWKWLLHSPSIYEARGISSSFYFLLLRFAVAWCSYLATLLTCPNNCSTNALHNLRRTGMLHFLKQRCPSRLWWVGRSSEHLTLGFDQLRSCSVSLTSSRPQIERDKPISCLAYTWACFKKNVWCLLFYKESIHSAKCIKDSYVLITSWALTKCMQAQALLIRDSKYSVVVTGVKPLIVLHQYYNSFCFNSHHFYWLFHTLYTQQGTTANLVSKRSVPA